MDSIRARLEVLHHAPDDVEAFRAYAAAVAAENPAWAELIVLSCNLAATPKEVSLARNVSSRRKKLERALLGAAYVDLAKANWRSAAKLEWWCGFVRRATFPLFDPAGYVAFAEGAAASGPIEVVAHRSVATDDPTPALASRPLPCPRSIVYGSADSRWPGLDRIAECLPVLLLEAHAESFPDTELRSTTLACARFDEPFIAPSLFDTLARSDLPRLETLVVDLGWFNVDEKTSPENRAQWSLVRDALERLASRPDALPALRRLALRSTGNPCDILALLLESPLGRRLTHLDLSQPVDAVGWEAESSDDLLLERLGALAPALAATQTKVHLVNSFARRESAKVLGEWYPGRFETRRSFADGSP